MEIDGKIKSSVIWACKNGQDEAVNDFISALLAFSEEIGVTIYDVREQLHKAQNEIEYFEPDSNDLSRVNGLLKLEPITQRCKHFEL